MEMDRKEKKGEGRIAIQASSNGLAGQTEEEN